jgi:superfamily II DNA/RNA helicase
MLVLVPTRELAIQVTNELKKLKVDQDEFRIEAIYGQTNIYDQISSLSNGLEIVVGTPGRIKDLIQRQKISFSDIRTFVLDETD